MSACKASRIRASRGDDNPTFSGLSARGNSKDILGFLFPELSRCERSAVRHRPELGEYNVGIDRRLSDPGAIAAIAACNHVFRSDTFGVTPNALRDQLRVFDEIRFRFDNSGNQYFPVGKLHAL